MLPVADESENLGLAHMHFWKTVLTSVCPKGFGESTSSSFTARHSLGCYGRWTRLLFPESCLDLGEASIFQQPCLALLRGFNFQQGIAC